MEVVVFVCAAAMILCGAVGVVALRHPVHAALSLVLTLFGIAVLFVVQEAHFLAAAQVIVYTGAIVVLLLFVIMLLGVDRVEDLTIEPLKVQRPLAVIAGVALSGLVIAAIVASQHTDTAIAGGGLVVAESNLDPHDGNIRALARDLFSRHVLAFELTSVLLVIAVVATVLLTRRARGVDAPLTSAAGDANTGTGPQGATR